MNGATTRASRDGITRTTSSTMFLRIVQAGLICLFLLYSVRFVLYSVVFHDKVQLDFYTDLTTLLALGLVLVLFTMSSPLNWRLSRTDALFILLGAGFLVFSVYKASFIAAIISVQIFILPFFMRWVRHVPRGSMKVVLSIFALASSLWMIGEFLILNAEWVQILSANSGIADLYFRFHETVIPSTTGIVGADIHRPHGMLGYILTSGVSLGMLCAFFLSESFLSRRIVDYVITLLLLTALVLSTSTTGILAFLAAFVVLNLLTKPKDVLLLKRIKISTLLFWSQ